MSHRHVIRTITTTITIITALAVPRATQAQWAVLDPTNLIQNTMTALKTAQTVVNTYTQIERLKDQIANQLQTLKSLDPTSFTDLKRLLDDGRLGYSTIRSDLNSLGFSVQEVNRDFDGLFPKDKDKWKTVRYSDYDGYYTRWNAELTSSSKAAQRAQSTITNVERNNQAIADILERSKGADGEVRQLQLVNQQLALIHEELGALVQNLNTSGRVLANMAAGSAGEKMLTREAKLRRRDGYTNLGRPPRTLRRLP